MAKSITASVGQGGVNLAADVATVQFLLNCVPEEQGGPQAELAIDGLVGPLTIGAITEPLYVGTPDWDVGRRTLTGPPEALAESLRAYGAMGVDQIQVRFRCRSRTELTDQMAEFGAEVAP